MDIRSLQHFPVTLFSSVMGIGGLSLAWRRAAHVWDTPLWIADALFWVAAAAFVLVAGLYATKWLRFPAAAKAELHHPVRMAFAPTLTIAMLVLATAGATIVPEPARVLWWAGAVGHLLATVAVLSAWFSRADITLDQVTPAWFIPIVGNVITPLAAVELGSVDLAWCAFGVGVVFWLALLPLLLQRILVHTPPLPDKLLPTMAIFIAPPSIALLSWDALSATLQPSVAAGLDIAVGHVLYGAAMMFVALLLAQVARLHRIPFALPYWAYTFPLAAASAAALRMAGSQPGAGYDVIAGGLLGLTSVVLAVVGALTLRAAVRGQICVPE